MEREEEGKKICGLALDTVGKLELVKDINRSDDKLKLVLA